MKEQRQEQESFEEVGQDEKQPSLLRDIFGMLQENRKFWLLPLILGLLIFGLLIAFGSTAAAPFIYTLF
jgi:Family of unknown function (DUF5989)